MLRRLLKLVWRDSRAAGRWCACWLAAAVLFFANVPGQQRIEWEFLGDWRHHAYYDHGWPLVYLARDSWVAGATYRPPNCWALAQEVIAFSPAALLVDGATAAMIVILVGLVQSRLVWRRSARFSLRTLLVAMAALSLVMAWGARWRRDHLEMNELLVTGRARAWADAVFGQAWGQLDGPTWIVEAMLEERPAYLTELAENDLQFDLPLSEEDVSAIRRAAVLRPKSVILALDSWNVDNDWSALARDVGDVMHFNVRLDEEEQPTDLRKLFAAFPRVRWLCLEVYLDNSAGLATLLPLPTLENLEVLELYGMAITDADLALIAKLPSLRTLVLYPREVESPEQATITSTGLAALKSAPKLESLALLGHAVRIDHNTSFKDFGRLRYLTLASVSKRDWQARESLPTRGLRGVSFNETLIAVSDVEAALAIPGIREIQARDCGLEDATRVLRGRHPQVDFQFR